MIKRIVISVLAGAIFPLLWWLGGYDFDRRGFEAVSCALISIYVVGAVYCFTGYMGGTK